MPSTWASAKADAAKVIAALPLGAGERMVEYPDPPSYRQFEPGQAWTWEYRRVVYQAVARLLGRRRLRVRWITIAREEFRGWLTATGRTDSEESRREFVAEKTAC